MSPRPAWPPTDQADLGFIALHTRMPYTTDFDGAGGGKPLTRIVVRTAIVAVAVLAA